MNEVSEDNLKAHLEHHDARRAGPLKQTHFQEDRCNTLVVTGGHPFAHEPFFESSRFLIQTPRSIGLMPIIPARNSCSTREPHAISTASCSMTCPA